MQTQIRLAEGASFKDVGLIQDQIKVTGASIQARVTTEDPEAEFRPATGRIVYFRPGEGIGIRLDGAAGFSGAVISPHYDSLLVKVTSRGQTHQQACKRLVRALAEFRVRGVTTNIPFIQNVLSHDSFVNDCVGTSFIDTNKELFDFSASKNRGGKILAYLAQVAVNGPKTPLATSLVPERVDPKPPAATIGKTGWKHVLTEKGPEGFAKAVRAHKGRCSSACFPRL